MFSRYKRGIFPEVLIYRGVKQSNLVNLIFDFLIYTVALPKLAKLFQLMPDVQHSENFVALQAEAKADP